VPVMEDAVSEYTTRPLSIRTWDAFARLCEKHNGTGSGGCWCAWLHPRRKGWASMPGAAA